MITFILAKLLQWLYGWGELTHDMKCALTLISALECVVSLMVVASFCFVELPGILKEKKKSK